MISFTYNGEPVGKGRPRAKKDSSGHPYVYTPVDTAKYERAVRQAFIDSGQIGYCADCELTAELIFNFSVPKSYTKKRRKACLEGTEGHIKSPDVDNCIKSVLDAIQGDGGAFVNDSQITMVYAYKRYAEEPSVEVKIWERRNEKQN